MPRLRGVACQMRAVLKTELELPAHTRQKAEESGAGESLAADYHKMLWAL